MSHIMIWKYREEDGSLMNYFDDGNTNPATTINFVDKLQIFKVPADAFPQFDSTIETVDGILEYTAGDFDIKLSLLQTETSFNGDTIENFLFPVDYPNKFLINVYFNDDCHYSGTFTTSDLSKELTFNQDQYHAKIHVTGILKEFAEAYSFGHRGTRIAGTSSVYSFETYLNFHFDSRLHWSFIFPETYYHTRIGDSTLRFNGQLQSAIDQHNGSNYFSSIPRWQTFRELAKGMGFNYRLKMENPLNCVDLFHPDFNLEIIFVPDILDKDAISIDVLEHNEDYSINSKKYVFAGLRHHLVYASASDYTTVIFGILFNKDETYNLDESAFSFAKSFRVYNNSYLFPSSSLYYEEYGARIRSWDIESELAGIECTLYPCPRFGSHIEAGSITYSQLFNGSSSPYDHTKVNGYLVECYKRLIIGNKKRKLLTVVFDGTQSLDLYSKISIGGVDYAIWAIESIDLQNLTAEIVAIEL